MLTREQRLAKGAMWLARWQGWKVAAVSMAEYARAQGFDAQESYRWRRILKRTSQWVDGDGAAAVATPRAPKKRKVVARFARVTVSDAPAAVTSLVLRLVLGNGRRAEFEVCGMTQLSELIGVLERAA